MTTAITARPATATTNSTRCTVKYRRVPEMSTAPATTMINVPIQKTPAGLATVTPQLVSVALCPTMPTAPKNDDRPTWTISPAASAP